jgi:hypothetical protein
LADQGCRWPHWHRVALTAEQLEQYDLPIIKKPDRRYRPIRYFDAVETEALRPGPHCGRADRPLDE